MARRVRRFSAFVTADTALIADTETVVATLSGVIGEFNEGRVVLQGFITGTGGVGVTSATLRVRRAALAGALVGEVASNAIAGNVFASAAITVEDTFAAGAPPIYVLTATMNAGAGSANMAELVALVT